MVIVSGVGDIVGVTPDKGTTMIATVVRSLFNATTDPTKVSALALTLESPMYQRAVVSWAVARAAKMARGSIECMMGYDLKIVECF